MKYIFIRITAKIHEIAAKSYIFALSFYFVNLFFLSDIIIYRTWNNLFFVRYLLYQFATRNVY